MSSVIQDAEQLSQQLVDTLLSPLIEPNKVRGRESEGLFIINYRLIINYNIHSFVNC